MIVKKGSYFEKQLPFFTIISYYFTHNNALHSDLLLGPEP